MGLLQQADGFHLQLDRLGFGQGCPFDIEIKLAQLEGVHHFPVGGGQGLGPQPPLGIGLGQAHPSSAPQGHHHIATCSPQGCDFAKNCHRLFMVAIKAEDIKACPGQLSTGARLHEAETKQTHSVLFGQAIQVGNGIQPHVYVGRKKLLLPEISATNSSQGSCTNEGHPDIEKLITSMRSRYAPSIRQMEGFQRQ